MPSWDAVTALAVSPQLSPEPYAPAQSSLWCSPKGSFWLHKSLCLLCPQEPAGSQWSHSMWGKAGKQPLIVSPCPLGQDDSKAHIAHWPTAFPVGLSCLSTGVTCQGMSLYWAVFLSHSLFPLSFLQSSPQKPICSQRLVSASAPGSSPCWDIILSSVWDRLRFPHTHRQDALEKHAFQAAVPGSRPEIWPLLSQCEKTDVASSYLLFSARRDCPLLFAYYLMLHPSLASPTTNTCSSFQRLFQDQFMVNLKLFLLFWLVSQFLPMSFCGWECVCVYVLRGDWLMPSRTIQVDHLTPFLYS